MMYRWTGGWAGMVWMIVFWVAILAVVYLIVRSLGSSESRAGRARDAMEILDERFARGEISEEEYASRRRVLEVTRR